MDNHRCPHCNGRLPRRLHYVHPDRGPESWLAVTSSIVITGALIFITYHKAGLNWPSPALQTTKWQIIGGAAYGFWLLTEGIIISTLHITVPALWEWLFPGERVRRVYADDWGFTRQGEGSWRRLPDGVSELQMWQYLSGVAAEHVTLSQRGAEEYGLDRDQSNAVKEWLIRIGWWRWLNEENGSGEFTAQGRRVLERLREGALWNEVISEVNDG